jgi:chromosome segregation ATPase
MRKKVLKAKKKASNKRPDVSVIKKELKDSLITIDIKENVIDDLQTKNNLLHNSLIESEKKLAELTATFNDIREKRAALEQIFESRCIELIATNEKATVTESNLNITKQELTTVSEKLEIAENKASAYEFEISKYNKQAAIKNEELLSLQLKLALLESSVASLTNDLTSKSENIHLANTLVESTKNELIIANSKNSQLETAVTNHKQNIRLLEEKITEQKSLNNERLIALEKINALQNTLDI